MTDYDVIVVGSGTGGLSAALRLSRLEKSVLLLEAMPSFGGYLNPFSRRGYTFDTGVHYLGKLGPEGTFRLLVQLLGMDAHVDFVELNPDGFDRYAFPDFELRLCKGRERYRQRLLDIFPKEAKAIDKYFHILDAMLSAIASTTAPPKNMFEKIMYVVRNPVLVRYFRSTYEQMLKSITPNRRLHAALSAHCANSGSPPSHASAFFGLLLLDHYLDGAYYPKGGSGAFRDAFIKGLEQQKAAMKVNARVVRIERRGDEFVVTTQSGEQFSARVVVSNADPLITFKELVDPELQPKALKKKVARLMPSTGAFYAFIGTSMDLPAAGLSDANIFHYDYADVDKCFNALITRKSTDAFPFYFITSPTLKDPDGRHAPQDHATLEIISGLDKHHPFAQWSGGRSRHRGGEYERLKAQYGSQLIKSAERYIPGLSGHLEYVEYATPLSNEYWVNSYQGANFGIEMTPAQFGPGRFYDCNTGIEGLFLVGSGTIGGGVLSCMASGVWAANQVVDFLDPVH